MLLVEEYAASGPSLSRQVDALPGNGTNSGAADTKLLNTRIDRLRNAIRRNEVTFPSQVPLFPKHDRPDLQQKVVQLYFVLGWSCPKVGKRYQLSALRVQQILNAWKRRAVELGYLQTVPPAECFLPLTSAPVRVIVSQVIDESSAPVIQPLRADALPGNDPPIHDRTAPAKGYRPRRRFGIEQIAGALKQFQAGRTAADIAEELGVSTCTVHAWKRRYEGHLLRTENIRLKDQLVKLGETQATLIDLITRSDKAEEAAFMLFLRVSPHTDSDYSESH